MTKIDAMTLEMEEYTLNANQVKDLVLARLNKDGLLTRTQCELYSQNWQVIVIKPSWFTNWCKKFGISTTGYKYKFVNFE